MAASRTKLPFEICDLIIDYARDDLHTMRRLARVSRAWHARSTVWLYNIIQVVDDLIGDSRYISEGAPYVTVRLHSLARFLATQPYAILRHIHGLRIACFWHDDEHSWSEFVSTWTSTPLPASLAIQDLHVFVKSQQNVGSLLQVLAFRFPALKSLHVHGTFAQGADMATCFAAFPSVKELGFRWSGVIPRAVLDVFVSAPGEWQAPPHDGCRLVADVSTLRPLLILFRSHRRRVKDLLVENIPPMGGDDVEDRKLIRGLHINATQAPLADSLRPNIQTAMDKCPRLQLLHVTATYGSDACGPWPVAANDASFDPIYTLERMLSWRCDVPEVFTCPSLRVLLVELKVPADDISLLWYHDWANLDRLLARNVWRMLEKVVISLCLTESDCLDSESRRKVLERFLRRALPWCAQERKLETRHREIPRRVAKRMRWVKLDEPRAEDGFIDFAHSDFEGPRGLHILDNLKISS
ncbi:hypothetical protein EXIGLDRAFT_753923 [Exidia glandulosa HHB12029]|uniref:F-box domain-containing protein n=1 Tax=Exidia glandulosa HHB12029 TaxID=1314781 RepID=A0A165DE42_EXIGL|nr:hypothetical protein EXIGLDRAFT_753923 [Exidia glandulosa HHB12029]